MSKIKPILPSLRERKRYLAFEILSENKIKDFSAISKMIAQSCHNFLGERDSAGAGIYILADKYDSPLQRGLIRVSHRYVDPLKAALLFIREIDGHRAIVRSIGVSGILKKAQNKYLCA